ncbi:hypothetical protein [Methylacidiphilum caldifontis]|uniref:Uncharacterized protein n=1 Tax=Methylacidiphilum caldifontis TaxID=2795386 RepID=A0A4Y8PHL8_9BACT|nr:hypothetical protein [Methylacidiphilum caldifontis]TFE72919.1 hypothetical protein A7Q10_03350 [Methylacidiphilum caldifontis]
MHRLVVSIICAIHTPGVAPRRVLDLTGRAHSLPHGFRGGLGRLDDQELMGSLFELQWFESNAEDAA